MPAPPTPPPPEVLAILDGMMCLPGVQAHHYAVVRRMLIDKLPLEAYSSSQLRTMTGKSKTTCKGIRRWLTARIKTGELVALTGGQNSDIGQDSVPRRDSASWLGGTGCTSVSELGTIHGSESCPRSEF